MSLEDVTVYATYGHSADTLKGLVRCSGPAGLFYTNAGYTAGSFTAPDWSALGSAEKILEDIALPEDVYGEVLQGTYQFDMKVLVSTGVTVFETTKTISFSYTKVTGLSVMDADCSTSVLTIEDTTNYDAVINGASISPSASAREFEVQHPVMADQTQTGTITDTSILQIGPNMYSGPYILSINTDLTYEVELWGTEYWFVLTDSLLHADHLDVVCDDCACDVYDCIVKLKADYEAAKTYGNKSETDRLQKLMTSLHGAWILMTIAKRCGKDSAPWCEQIKTIIALADCSCSTTDLSEPKEIIPWAAITFGGGGSSVQWHYVSGTTPSVGLGQNNDFALCSDGTIWQKQTGVWVFLMSIIGATGATGAQGDPGNDGSDGSTILTGTGDPDGVVSGIDGDLFLDIVSFDLYYYDGVWTLAGNLVGPAGTPKEILFGVIAPSNANGVDGDVYVDTATGNVYKKITGAWVLQGNIKGPIGLTGATGTAGSQILNGTTAPGAIGVNGDYYVNSVTGDLYYKSGGTWTLIVNLMGPQGPPGYTAAVCLFNGWDMTAVASGLLPQVLGFFPMTEDTIEPTHILDIEAIFELATATTNVKKMFLNFGGTQLCTLQVSGAVTSADKMVKMVAHFHRTSTTGASWNYEIYRTGATGTLETFGVGSSTEDFTIENLITAAGQIEAPTTAGDIVCHTLTVKHWKTVQY